ncbi:MAG: sigma 54-interacting transcriptional regulator [Myxococcota bacterium]
MATTPLRERSQLLRFDATTNTLRARSFHVRVLSGPDTGKTLTLTGTATVGTHPQATLQLQDNTVSGFHLELAARSDGVRVRDLDSTNGTFLAGARIREAVLESGRLELGTTWLELSCEEQDLGRPDAQPSFGQAIGKSAQMRGLFGLLNQIAPTDSTVLLWGETGTGKEVIARAIHDRSPRCQHPFVVVDCSSLVSSLAESELFGHVRGAFTGAVSDREGAFLQADGGTIFLDEIGELPLEVQGKLLRVLDASAVRKVGEDRPRQVDVRVVAATHRNLSAEVGAGRFRKDLFFRLAVVLARVPPLRERPDDIPPLAREFLRQAGRADLELSAELLGKLCSYGWPGNVRELRNVIERVVTGVGFDSRSEWVETEQKLLPFKEAKERLVDVFAREYIAKLLEASEGNLSEAARRSGINRNHVQRLAAKYGVRLEE